MAPPPGGRRDAAHPAAPARRAHAPLALARPFAMQSQTASPEPEARFAHWQRNRHALFAATLCSTLGFSCAWPFLPLVVRDLGIAAHLETWVGYLLGGFFAVSFFLTPVWGALADHFGRKGMVLRAGFGMGLGFAVLPFLGDVRAFLAVFLLVGATNGFVPAALALVAGNTPPAGMGRALASVQMGALLGTTGGPVLGAGLALILPSYRDLFWASALLMLLAGTLTLALVREAAPPAGGPFRPHVLRDLLICLRLPAVPALYGINLVFSMTMFGSTTVVSVYALYLLQGAPAFLGLGIGPWVGLATMALTVTSALAVPFWGRALDRVSPGSVLALALLASVPAALLFPFVQNPLQLTVARAVLGALAVGIQPAALLLMRNAAPAGMDARVLAYATSLNMLGNGAAPFLAGLLGPWLGLRAYFAGIAALLLACGAYWSFGGLRAARAR